MVIFMQKRRNEMDNKEFYRQMKELEKLYGDDEEKAHGEMDYLMCKLLISLGYEEGISIFYDQPKYYA